MGVWQSVWGGGVEGRSHGGRAAESGWPREQLPATRTPCSRQKMQRTRALVQGGVFKTREGGEDGPRMDHKDHKICGPLVVQWLGLHASTASSLGSIPSRGTKIPKAEQHSRKEKKSAFPGYREDQVEPSWGVHCLTY